MVFYITNQLSTGLFPEKFPRVSVEEALEYLWQLVDVAVDTETEGFDPYTKKLLLLQLGDYDVQYVIDTTTVDIQKFRKLLETKLLILANAQFDLTFLYHHNIWPTRIFDVMLAEIILTAGYRDEKDLKDLKEVVNTHVAESYINKGISLDKISKKYCNVTLDKAIRSNFGRVAIAEREIQYAADDVKYLHKIKEDQLKAFEEFKIKYGTTDELLDLENEVVKVFALMNYNGVRVDAARYSSEVIKKVEEEVRDITTKLNQIIIDEFQYPYTRDMFTGALITIINWNSPKQKLKLLNRIIPGIASTNAATIAKHSHKHKIFGSLASYNKMKKLQSSFGLGFLDHINTVSGRIHTNFWQILATGRISCNNPNLNQIPSKGELGPVIRSCFVPKSKDYCIVGGDYSGFELRIIAEFSQDPLWLKVFNEGGDLHSVLCSETFGIPIEDVHKPFPKNPDITYRALQKTINFGLAYGMSEYKLAATAQISVDEARAIIKRFFAKVPRVARLLTQLGEMATARGFIRTSPPYSRVRLFPKWFFLKDYPRTEGSFKWLGQIERQGKNTPIQGTNGDIIKKALIMVQKEIDENNWDVTIILSVYDEIQTECLKSQADAWKVKLQQLMIEAAEEVIKSVPVVVDVDISEYWKK